MLLTKNGKLQKVGSCDRPSAWKLFILMKCTNFAFKEHTTSMHKLCETPLKLVVDEMNKTLPTKFN